MASDNKKPSKDKKKQPMYYAQPEDRELIRDSDEGTEDSSDPFETDSYGPEDDQGLEDGMPFSLPGEGTMPPSDRSAPVESIGMAVKLRKKGAPKRGY